MGPTASIYAIKARIKGVESTGKITKTMKLVSTAKLHQTQIQIARLEDFAEKCRQSMSLVLSDIDGDECPLLKAREIKKVCYVLFVGNRGLCGAYNWDVLRFMRAQLQQEQAEYFTLICGRWSGEHRQDKSLKVERCFDDIDDIPSQEQSQELSRYIQELYVSGRADKVVLVYQRRESMGQRPQAFQLLPLDENCGGKGGDCIFEPDKLSLVNTLSRMYVDNNIAKVLLQAKVSEHFARMTAMTNAIDNADELLHELNLTLNRTRQAKITTEISEVVGGANALRNGE